MKHKIVFEALSNIISKSLTFFCMQGKRGSVFSEHKALIKTLHDSLKKVTSYKIM